MPTGPNRLSTIQRVAIRIDEVDIPNRAVHGYDKTNVLIVATFRETSNGILYVPAQGERWIAERQGQGQWRIVTRLDSADQQTYVESTLGPGDMRIAAENIYFTGTVHGVGGGGGGSVTSVTAGDASVVVGGTATDPTIETADLHTISSLHATAGDVDMNSHRIINLTPGVLGTDAATVSQIPTSLVTSFNTRTGAITLLKADVTGTGLSYSDVGALGATAAAGGDLAGNFPNPTIKSNVNLPGAPTTTTPSTADNSTKIATTAYVQAQGYLTTAVTSFNTRTGAVTLTLADVTGTGLSFSDVGALGATAAAGGDLTGNYPNPTIKSSVGLSGNPTTTTQTATDSSTKIATTAFVHAAIAADSVVRIQVTQTSHGFSVGNVLYYTGSVYALAKADNADDAEVVGIVATVVDANNFILQAAGEVTGLSGLTAGTTYFLSDTTAGLLTATAPTANGSILKPLGVAVSTTALFFFNMRGEVIQASASFPSVTTSAWSGGPPSSPSDGDLWIASGVDSNGTRWQFQYNAGSASAYKWEFIGGPPMRFPYHDVSAYLNTMTNSGYTMGLGYTVYLDNAILVTPGRAGEYLVRGSYTVDNNSVNANIVALQPIYSGGGAGNVWTSAYCDGSLRWGHIALADTPITIGATDHVWLGLSSSDPTSIIARWNAGGVTPVRIS